MTQKQTGSFYTPYPLVKFMLNNVNFSGVNKILEPSVGDGRFIEKILKPSIDAHITCVDLVGEKIDYLKGKYSEINRMEYINNDYIKYSVGNDKRFDLILGNPPYLEKKRLSEENIEISNKLLETLNLDKKMYKNIWVMFLVASIELLSEEGKIFFVLPFEFLQVNYAKILRNYLEKEFNIIEITTFREKVFSEVDQEVCLVYLEKKDVEPHIKYMIYDELNSKEPSLQVNIKRHKPLDKWSNAILNDEEIDLLSISKKKYLSINELGRISPGIVTGANSYFILNGEKVKEHKIEEHVLPIISKSRDVRKKLEIAEEDFEDLKMGNKDVYLLNLQNANSQEYHNELKGYLDTGIEEKIHKRYKCSKRSLWYGVPLVTKGDLIFFKRFHETPRLVINESQVYTTDICYNIRLSEKYDRDSVAFCFYNSLTIALCEYNGRFYGGGVAELTPSEFKDLAIPYKKIKKMHIENLKRLFKEEKSLDEILDYVDEIVFKDVEDEDTLLKIRNIRKKYLLRRLKKES